MSDTLKRKLSEDLDLPAKQPKVAASDSPDCAEQASTECAKDTPDPEPAAAADTAEEVGTAQVDTEENAHCAPRAEETKAEESPPPPQEAPTVSSASAEPAEAATTQADRGSEAPAVTQSDSQS